jgi:hypothetical protein
MTDPKSKTDCLQHAVDKRLALSCRIHSMLYQMQNLLLHTQHDEKYPRYITELFSTSSALWRTSLITRAVPHKAPSCSISTSSARWRTKIMTKKIECSQVMYVHVPVWLVQIHVHVCIKRESRGCFYMHDMGQGQSLYGAMNEYKTYM